MEETSEVDIQNLPHIQHFFKRKRVANRQYDAYVVKNVVEKYENLHSKCYEPSEANKRHFQQSTICSTVPASNACTNCVTEEQIKLPYSQFKRQLSDYFNKIKIRCYP